LVGGACLTSGPCGAGRLGSAGFLAPTAVSRAGLDSVVWVVRSLPAIPSPLPSPRRSGRGQGRPKAVTRSAIRSTLGAGRSARTIAAREKATARVQRTGRLVRRTPGQSIDRAREIVVCPGHRWLVAVNISRHPTPARPAAPGDALTMQGLEAPPAAAPGAPPSGQLVAPGVRPST
jgi:hypothetical protein